MMRTLLFLPLAFLLVSCWLVDVDWDEATGYQSGRPFVSEQVLCQFEWTTKTQAVRGLVPCSATARGTAEDNEAGTMKVRTVMAAADCPDDQGLEDIDGAQWCHSEWSEALVVLPPGCR